MTESEALALERELLVWNTQMGMWLTDMVVSLLPPDVAESEDLAPTFKKMKLQRELATEALVKLIGYYKQPQF